MYNCQVFFLIINLEGGGGLPLALPPSLPFTQNASSCSVIIVSEAAYGRVGNTTSWPIILAFTFPKLKPLEEDSLVKIKHKFSHL